MGSPKPTHLVVVGTGEHHEALETRPPKAVGSHDTWDCTSMEASRGGCATRPQHQAGTWNKDNRPMCDQIWGYGSDEALVSLSPPFLCPLPGVAPRVLSSYTHLQCRAQKPSVLGAPGEPWALQPVTATSQTSSSALPSFGNPKLCCCSTDKP